MSAPRLGMTCRDVERWLLSHGFERVPLGKGSHRRYARGRDRVTLPYKRGGDEVSPTVMRSVPRGRRQARGGGLDD